MGSRKFYMVYAYMGISHETVSYNNIFFFHVYIPSICVGQNIYNLAQITIPKSLDLTCHAPLEYNFCKQLSYITGFFFLFFFYGYLYYLILLYFFEKKLSEILLKKKMNCKAKQKAKLREDPIGKQHLHPRVNLPSKSQDLQIKLPF